MNRRPIPVHAQAWVDQVAAGVREWAAAHLLDVHDPDVEHTLRAVIDLLRWWWPLDPGWLVLALEQMLDQ